MRIAIYGSSLLSSYWNGAATYYRGIVRALADHGHQVVFYEPDAWDRQKHRDIDPPAWAHVVVYPATDAGVARACSEAAEADVVVKTSGVGVYDTELLELTAANARDDALRIFWDVDAPATLDEMARDPAHPVRRALPGLDLVLTYGGGPPVMVRYEEFGAARCVPVYNALDPDTHRPEPAVPAFCAALSLLANRLPDREARIEDFFLSAARRLPHRDFLLGGAGWQEDQLPANVRAVGHVPTALHNRFNCSAAAVLNVGRESMVRNGYSPATRVFEAAGAAACLITDAWEGIERFLEPDAEVLVARDGAEVAEHLRTLTPGRAREIGGRARARMLAEHTYRHRGRQLSRVLEDALAQKRQGRRVA